MTGERARPLIRRASRALERLAARPLGAWLLITFWSPIGRVLLRLSRGRLGSVLARPVLLLTTTGLRSGRPRTVPLLYLADGDRLVLIASRGGSRHHPAWYLNLRARPEAEVEISGARSAYAVREAEGEALASEDRQGVGR